MFFSAKDIRSRSHYANKRKSALRRSALHEGEKRNTDETGRGEASIKF